MDLRKRRRRRKKRRRKKRSLLARRQWTLNSFRLGPVQARPPLRLSLPSLTGNWIVS
jgi:hypothetical protein